MRPLAVFLVFSFLSSLSFADDKIPLSEAAERALKISQLTTPGSAPFHFKAAIAELNSPDSDYKAEVEEFWESPDMWRRVISTAEYSETVVANGDKVLWQFKGDYSPHWLQEFVTAFFDPLPMLANLKQASGQFNTGNPNRVSCVRFVQRVGFAAAQNSVFTVVCLRGDGRLDSVVSPGYNAQFEDFKVFKGKRVPLRIRMEAEPGTTIEARISELSELTSPDPQLFTLKDVTPENDRIQKMRVSEAVARGNLVSSPEIKWNPVRDGKIHGTLSMYISVDREGRVRETYPLNSDNSFPLDQARKEVMNWKFKPMLLKSTPVQFETILTFAYETRVENAVPVLSDAEARKLATATAEPVFLFQKPAKGTVFTIRAAVDETGNVIGLKNVHQLDASLVGAANAALKKWRFRPYIRGGKPEKFDADITFRVE